MTVSLPPLLRVHGDGEEVVAVDMHRHDGRGVGHVDAVDARPALVAAGDHMVLDRPLRESVFSKGSFLQ